MPSGACPLLALSRGRRAGFRGCLGTLAPGTSGVPVWELGCLLGCLPRPLLADKRMTRPGEPVAPCAPCVSFVSSGATAALGVPFAARLPGWLWVVGTGRAVAWPRPPDSTTFNCPPLPGGPLRRAATSHSGRQREAGAGAGQHPRREQLSAEGTRQQSWSAHFGGSACSAHAPSRGRFCCFTPFLLWIKYFLLYWM